MDGECTCEDRTPEAQVLIADDWQVLLCPNYHVWEVAFPGFPLPASPPVCRICHIPGITLHIPLSLLHHEANRGRNIASQGSKLLE